jgi:hypothetical protein
MHVPYAFSPPNTCFDEATGRYLLGPTRMGLTCATFVLAIFDAARLPLVDYSSWPTHRPGDAEWQQKVISMLRGRVSHAHISAMERDVGGARYRPEEIAGAATVSPLPSAFSIAEARANAILVILNSPNRY